MRQCLIHLHAFKALIARKSHLFFTSYTTHFLSSFFCCHFAFPSVRDDECISNDECNKMGYLLSILWVSSQVLLLFLVVCFFLCSSSNSLSFSFLVSLLFG